MSYLFIDVEATGTEKEDRLIQVAYRVMGEKCWDVNEMFKPPVPVKLTAMAVHHVTEKMIADSPSFEGSATKAELQLLIDNRAVFIAHNAKYDLGMFAKEGLIFPLHICTLKIARYIDKGGKFENHQLQYLRYHYGIEVEAVAHDAFGDIVVLEAVFWKLFSEFLDFEYGTQDVHTDTAIVRMIEISSMPTLLRGPLTFGKYQGKTLEQIVKGDRGYLEWLLKAKLEKPEGEEDWIFTLKKHLNI